MSDQVMPASPGSGEQPANVRPEDLQTVPAAEAGPGPVPAGPELAPAPGGSMAPPPGQSAAAPPRLSHDDVAAVIAAAPGAGQPPANVPGTLPVPATAGDVDVIEPEWVDKADEVVKTHQGDPYGEEEGIEELQVDYLQKRYGISVKDADNPPDSSSAGKPKGP